MVMTTSAQEEQKLRKAYAGSTTTQTFFSRAEAELAQEAQGRHSTKAVVNGSKPIVGVPRQPEGSPWHSDIVPPEGPLGYATDAQESVGEPHEIAASLNPLGDVVVAREEEEPSLRPAPSVVLSPADGANFRRGRKL
jgi:hypothetical protein